MTTENGQAIHQGLMSRAGLGFLHPLFESAGQPADDDDRADTSLGEPPTLSSPVLWGLRPMPRTSRAVSPQRPLPALSTALSTSGRALSAPSTGSIAFRLDGLMSTRAVNNDSVRVPEHRYAARESATGWRAAGRQGPAVWPVGCIPRGRQRCLWTMANPAARTCSPASNVGGLDKSVRAALRTRGPVDDSAFPSRVDRTTPPASGSHSLRSGPPSADCPIDRRPEVPGAEPVEAGAEPSLR